MKMGIIMQRFIALYRRKSAVLAGMFILLFQFSTLAQQDSTMRQDSTKRMAPPTGDAQTASSSAMFFSLQQCVRRAAVKNQCYWTNNTEFTKESAKINRDQQRGNMLPFISGTASYSNNGGRNLNINTYTYITTNNNSAQGQLSANLVLWNGFSIQNFIRQYSLLYDADKMDWQQAKDQVTVNVILAYLNVLSTLEQLGMAEKQAESTRKRVQLLQIQNKEGAISPSDLSDMKGQLGSDQLTVANTQNALEANKMALAQYMNIPYSPQLEVVPLGEDLTPAAYSATIDQIYQNAIQNLAQVKAADLHLASATRGVKAARGSMAPTLSLFGGVSTNYSSTAFGQTYRNTTYDSTGGYAKVSNSNLLPVFLPQFNYTNQGISFGDQVKNDVSTQVGLQLNIPILNGLRSRSAYHQSPRSCWNRQGSPPTPPARSCGNPSNLIM